MIVYVATYSHRQGTEVAVFSTDAKAQAWAEALAAEWWDAELGWNKELSADKPTDPAELADAYFSRVEDEFFDVSECVIDA